MVPARSPSPTDPPRRWEPKRLRIFSIAARLIKGGRRLRLRLADRRPWADLLTSAITRLQAGTLTSHDHPDDTGQGGAVAQDAPVAGSAPAS